MPGKLMFIAEYSSVSKDLSKLFEDYFSIQYCHPEGTLIHESLSVSDATDLIFISLADLRAYYAIAGILGFRWKKNYPVIIFGTKEECGRFEVILDKELSRRKDETNYVFGRKDGPSELALHITYITRPTTNNDILERVLAVYNFAKNKQDKAPSEKKKILMVDDDAMMMRRVKKELEGKYKVYVATSGAAGIALIEQHHPDALLLDYEMPGYDGKQIYEIIRMNQETKELPIFFLTGVSDGDRARDIINLRPQGYILKNSGNDAILNTLNDFFNNR